MIYTFDENAGAPVLIIKSETYKYLIKVRRHQIGDSVTFRAPSKPDERYDYTLSSIDGRQAVFELLSYSTEPVVPAKPLHIGWCIIDPKSVEKVLPSLNEIGVTKITFIQSDRSQKNFKHDLKRYERILESSMQQCGRTHKMEFAFSGSLQDFLTSHPDTAVFDFCDATYDGTYYDTVVIGPEGGFSNEERSLFNADHTFRFDTPLVLRSETAAISVASKLLL